MSDKPKPGGRYDRAALAKAVELNRRITGQLRKLVMREVDYREVLELVHLVGLDLAEQRDRLAEMDTIRRDYGSDAPQ